jgi:hypothetical protein
MVFDYARFKTLTGGIHIQASSVDALRTLVQAERIADRDAHARAVIAAMRAMPVIKIEKYAAGLKYLIENYVPLIVGPAPAAVHPGRLWNQDLTGAALDRGDLVYGLGEDWARAHPRYAGALFTGPRYADVYNNTFGIGTGRAFGVGSTPASVQQHIAGVDVGMGDAAVQKRAYIEGLMRSRFAPTSVFNLTPAELAQNSTGPRGRLTPAALNGAIWYKAIRRACKYGLEMLATDPVFTSRSAQVHFVLDGLGDLTNMAMKKTRDESSGAASRSDYVPITTSEICYVFRNWDRLRGTVRFWVNGSEVQAPWLSDWTVNDVRGRPIRSGWDAWQRYALRRQIIKGKG